MTRVVEMARAQRSSRSEGIKFTVRILLAIGDYDEYRNGR